MSMDSDLLSIQQARDLAVAAHQAQKQWARATQAQVDRACEAMAMVAYRESERLARMACEETGYGVPSHKTLKNHLSSKILWDAIRETRTVGIIRQDEQRQIYDIAWPIGMVTALIPSTNPTSTAIFKIIIAIKARNGIVIAPHPAAVGCTSETARTMSEAAEEEGMPPALVSCMTEVTMSGTQALMKHKYTSLILATGGAEMVRAAHSVGKPAYGVGPGNVPCYVDRTADIARAARYIVASKAFDHSVICSTEQAVVADQPIAVELARLMENEGAFFVDQYQARRLSETLFQVDGTINAASVGKSPQELGNMAGITVPDAARILVAPLEAVGREVPLSREKLTTVLGWYEADGWEAGCDRCIELIKFGGRGHSLVLHAEDEDVIMAFGLEKPAFRIVVNTMGTLGTTGLTTGLTPSMTLGPGGIGGAITGDNISVQHMFNIKRLAYETRPAPEIAMRSGLNDAWPKPRRALDKPQHNPSQAEIEALVARVMDDLE